MNLTATFQWNTEDCTYVLPSTGFTKSFYSGIPRASEQKDVQLLSPWFFPPHLGLHYSMKTICRIYFALITFRRQGHHSYHLFYSYQKLSGKFVQCFTQTEVALSPPYPYSTSPQDLGLFGVSGIAHTAHMVGSANKGTTEQSRVMLRVSPHAPT